MARKTLVRWVVLGFIGMLSTCTSIAEGKSGRSPKKTPAVVCCKVEGASAIGGHHEMVAGRGGEELVVIALNGTKDAVLSRFVSVRQEALASWTGN
uniref:Uncharacterized protein n=1 Tax=Peronospora matthiolae TaxID=2874970 RepID=A0AAV1UNT8_9STRA